MPLTPEMQLAPPGKSKITDEVRLRIDGHKYRDVLWFGRRTCALGVNGSNDESRIWNPFTIFIHSYGNRLRNHKSTRERKRANGITA
jgi:hypothetical protein